MGFGNIKSIIKVKIIVTIIQMSKKILNIQTISGREN